MIDRVPTKPNRYAVYDDSHNFLRYEYHERADEPTEAGTALNKANLLSDATAALINTLAGSTPSTPDAALSKITGKAQAIWDGRVRIAYGSYTGTGTYGSSNPTVYTFDFPAKIVMITPKDGDNINIPTITIDMQAFKSTTREHIAMKFRSDSVVAVYRSNSDVDECTSISFFNNDSSYGAYNQLNYLNFVYYVTYFG